MMAYQVLCFLRLPGTSFKRKLQVTSEDFSVRNAAVV